MLRAGSVIPAVTAVLLGTSVALAQPAASAQEQVAFFQRAIGALQAQRNTAEDAVAQAQAQLAGVSADLQKAQAEIKSLQAELEKAKPAASVPPPNATPVPAPTSTPVPPK